jgi:thiol-disulfide isomerase/thioredoxin
MKKIFLLLFVHFTMNIFAQETGTKFIEDQTLAQLLQKAGSENKLIFMDCYATWCGPCKYLSKNIFPQKEVADFYNTHFICAKFDMEQGEGIEIAKKYKVKAYPTLLFLDAKGNIVHIKVGAGDANDIINLGKLAGDPENNYMAIVTKMKAGDKSAEIIDKYLTINPYASDKESLLDSYFSSLNEQDKVTVKSWSMINKYVEEYDNKFFKLLLTNEDKFKKIADPRVIDNKILQIFYQYIAQNSVNQDQSAKVEKELKALNHPLVNKAYSYIQMVKAYMAIQEEITPEGWKTFINSAKELLDNFSDGNIYNKMAWFVYENYKKVNDTEALKLAKEWALKSIQLEKNAYNTDTYANIVFELGESAEAVKYETEAVDIANKAGDQEMAKSLNERLDFFKNNQKK